MTRAQTQSPAYILDSHETQPGTDTGCNFKSTNGCSNEGSAYQLDAKGQSDACSCWTLVCLQLPATIRPAPVPLILEAHGLAGRQTNNTIQRHLTQRSQVPKGSAHRPGCPKGHWPLPGMVRAVNLPELRVFMTLTSGCRADRAGCTLTHKIIRFLDATNRMDRYPVIVPGRPGGSGRLTRPAPHLLLGGGNLQLLRLKIKLRVA